MDQEIGIVCGRCDAYSAMGSLMCPACGNALALEAPRPIASRAPLASGVPPTQGSATDPVVGKALYTEPPPSILAEPLRLRRSSTSSLRAATDVRDGETTLTMSDRIPVEDELSSVTQRVAAPVDLEDMGEPAEDGEPVDLAALADAANMTVEELMDQAKNFVCRSCQTPVPVGHKFCGRCGAAIPPEILGARTQFFGQLQAPGKAKLILIRGEGVEGLSYQLNAEQHVVGRNGQLVFPDDPFVSPKHANLFYRNGKLVVRDEGSLNGVYYRVKGAIDVHGGDHFLCGEQLFRLDVTPKANDGPAPDGTYFYSSPKHQSPFRVTQILHGGAPGMCVCARTSGLQIGREGGDLNFPSDLYMSASHCKLDEASGKLTLTDLNSRNGTYVRLKQERELGHGDYLFIGRKLLRVEITAA